MKEIKAEETTEMLVNLTKIMDKFDVKEIKNIKAKIQKLEEEKVNSNEQLLTETYQILLNPNELDKYEAAFELSKNIDFVRKQESLKPLVDVIAKFFNEIDLDKMTLEKTAENSFSLSTPLVKIFHYVKAMYHLNNYDLLHKNRVILVKTLPIICCTLNSDVREMREIYKSVIGSISENEKSELVEWWESREDDFMNISSEDIFTCITDYGIDALSYKLEKCIE